MVFRNKESEAQVALDDLKIEAEVAGGSSEPA